MERSGRRWSALIAPVVSIAVLLYFTADMWAPIAAPFLPEQHIERPTEGFAMGIPPDWEYVLAAEADASEWWEADETGSAKEHHEAFLADGGLLMSRTRSPLVTFQWCRLQDLTSLATMPPAWVTVEDAEATFTQTASGSAYLIVETTYLDLSAGRTLVVDSRWPGPTEEREYVYTDGQTWFFLQCAAEGSAPDDDWLSIAETFEFLPTEE